MLIFLTAWMLPPHSGKDTDSPSMRSKSVCSFIHVFPGSPVRSIDQGGFPLFFRTVSQHIAYVYVPSLQQRRPEAPFAPERFREDDGDLRLFGGHCDFATRNVSRLCDGSNVTMTKPELQKKEARERLEEARKLISAGEWKAAETILASIATPSMADPALRLGSETVLGMPRKVQSALLKIAKLRPDSVAKAGLQYLLVPPPSLLLPLTDFSLEERRDMNELNRQPVPRMLHQIWLGQLPVPPSAAKWKRHAEQNGFRYRLWREADLEALNVPRHPAFVEMMEAGDLPGAVDVARYFILHTQGGIYLDCDWYPARDDLSFSDVLPLIGLSALLEDTPRDTGLGSALLTNSFIATPAGHPVFARLLDIIPEATRRLPDGPAWWSTGPLIMTLLFRRTTFTVPDAAFVAANLQRRAPIEEVEAAQSEAQASGNGLLIGWKSW